MHVVINSLENCLVAITVNQAEEGIAGYLVPSVLEE